MRKMTYYRRQRTDDRRQITDDRRRMRDNGNRFQVSGVPPEAEKLNKVWRRLNPTYKMQYRAPPPAKQTAGQIKKRNSEKANIESSFGGL